MAKNIIAIILSYIFIVIFATAALAFTLFIMGFSDSLIDYITSPSLLAAALYLLITLITSFLAGLICYKISNSINATRILILLVLTLGTIDGLQNHQKSHNPLTTNSPRTTLSLLDMMQFATTPTPILILSPLASALGIFLGTRFTSSKK